MIEQTEWLQLEGKFWKCGPAEQHELVITEWSIKPVAFKDQPSKPYLCARIIRLDGQVVDKEFQTRNQTLIPMLRTAIVDAQKTGKISLQLWLSRGLSHDYRVSITGGA